MTSGKRGRDGKSRDSADRSYEQESDYSSSSSEEQEERGATKRSKTSESHRKDEWSEVEELKLKKLREEDKQGFKEIAKSLPRRSAQACERRYASHVNEGEKRVTLFWSSNDDKQLKKLKEDGLVWKDISKSFPGRSSKACSQRYSDFVNEAEKRAKWSSKDDKQLKKLREEDGKEWKEIAKSFP
jgi:hypothetical protein